MSFYFRLLLISESKCGLLHKRRSDLLELKEKGTFVGVMLRKEEGCRTSLTNLVPEAWSCKSACVFRWWFTDEQTWVLSNWPVLWEVCACVPAGCGSVLEMALCPVCVLISLVLAVYRLRAGLACLGTLYRRPKELFFFLCILRRDLRPCSSSLKGIANSV